MAFPSRDKPVDHGGDPYRRNPNEADVAKIVENARRRRPPQPRPGGTVERLNPR